MAHARQKNRFASAGQLDAVKPGALSLNPVVDVLQRAVQAPDAALDAVNPAESANPALATITAPGQVIQVSALKGSFGSPNNLLWQTSTFTFQATSALSTLTLSSTDNGSGGVFFDGLSVTAVPEPATWALMIGGFGMAGALLRRQRRMTLAA